MSLVAAVSARLVEEVPALAGRVQGAAKLADLTRQGATFQADRAAFVLPLGFRGGKVDSMTGMYVQSIDRLVGVVLMVRNLADATGAAANADLDPLIEDVVGALAGWSPSEEAFGVIVPASGELAQVVAGTITYQLNFGLADQLRIAR